MSPNAKAARKLGGVFALLWGDRPQRRRSTATAAFRRAISEPGVMDAFDAEFGGLPSVAHDTPRAA